MRVSWPDAILQGLSLIHICFVCDVCGWVYDEAEGYEDGGIAPGTLWADVPEDFECPLCGVGKDQFSQE